MGLSRLPVLVAATLWKLWRVRLLNRWAFFLEVFSTTSMLLVFFLIDRFQGSLFGDRLKAALEGANTSYFGYVALGIAVSELANSSVGGVLGQFQEEKRYNTMEEHIAAGCSVQLWAITAGIANLFRAGFQFLLIYAVAVGILGLPVPEFRVELALLVLACGFVPLWCLALFSLGSVLLFRRGYVFGFLVSTCFDLLGGVYVPLSALPGWLRQVSELLPITPALRAMQTIFYRQGTFADIRGDLVQLLALGALLLPLGLAMLAFTDRAAKRRGHYALE